MLRREGGDKINQWRKRGGEKQSVSTIHSISKKGRWEVGGALFTSKRQSTCGGGTSAGQQDEKRNMSHHKNAIARTESKKNLWIQAQARVVNDTVPNTEKRDGTQER